MGRKGRRGTCDGEGKHMSVMQELDLWTRWGSGCYPPWRRPSCWSEAACRSEGCSSRRGAGTRTAAAGPTLGFQGLSWCGTWWDSWARTRVPLWGRGEMLTLIWVSSVALQPPTPAYPAHRWTFSPRWKNAQTASSGAAGRPAGWSCHLWACWGGTPTPSGQTLLPRRSGSLSLRCLLAAPGLHPAGTCMTVTSGSEKHCLTLHKPLSPIRSSEIIHAWTTESYIWFSFTCSYINDATSRTTAGRLRKFVAVNAFSHPAAT